MMKNILIAILAIAVLNACQNKSEESNTNLKDTATMEKLAKQDIENLISVYKETLNSANAEKATALYTKDGIFMPAGAPSSIGSENIKGTYNYVFSQIQLNLEFYIEEITVENDLAYAVTSSKGTTVVKATGDTIPDENRELFVFEKENGSWKIARYMFNKSN